MLTLAGNQLKSHLLRAWFHKMEKQVLSGLFFECLGSSTNLRDAVESCTNGANIIADIIALSANAYVEALSCELAYEVTEGLREREFFQHLFPVEPILLPPKRKINVECTYKLIQAISGHKDAERILRAIAHYRDMLSKWKLEERLRSVTTAFICAEALGEVALRQLLEKRGKTKKELAIDMSIDIQKSNWNTHSAWFNKERVYLSWRSVHISGSQKCE